MQRLILFKTSSGAPGERQVLPHDPQQWRQSASTLRAVCPTDQQWDCCICRHVDEGRTMEAEIKQKKKGFKNRHNSDG